MMKILKSLAILLLASQANARQMDGFSIVDLPFKYKKLQVIAHMDDGTDCPVTLDKDEFYGKYSKDTKELFALLKESCEDAPVRLREDRR